MTVVLTMSAIADLEGIGDRIAADSPVRALQFVAALRGRCLQLAEVPRAFPLVPRYESEGIRRRPVGDYLIFYRESHVRINVLRILHGAQDYEPLLFPRD